MAGYAASMLWRAACAPTAALQWPRSVRCEAGFVQATVLSTYLKLCNVADELAVSHAVLCCGAGDKNDDWYIAVASVTIGY